MRVIYENDMPSIDDVELATCTGRREDWIETKSRFKPNGITDNRKAFYLQKDAYGNEWNRQRQFAKEDYRIDLLAGKIEILN